MQNAHYTGKINDSLIFNGRSDQADYYINSYYDNITGNTIYVTVFNNGASNFVNVMPPSQLQLNNN